MMLHFPSFYSLFFPMKQLFRYPICLWDTDYKEIYTEYIYTDYKETYSEASLGISFFHKENDIFPRKKKRLNAIFLKKTLLKFHFCF